jgi:hypothetical protein
MAAFMVVTKTQFGSQQFAGLGFYDEVRLSGEDTCRSMDTLSIPV